MLKAELRVLSSNQTGAVIPLPEGKFLIGREHDCHLRPNSELVSRHHCAFTLDDYTLRLRDLGSTNGTLVNGERLRGTVVLKPGDHVVVGKLEFQVVIDGQPPLTADETLLQAQDETLVGGRPARAPGQQTVEDFAAIPPSAEEPAGDADTQFAPAAAMEQTATELDTTQMPTVSPDQHPAWYPQHQPQPQWAGQPGYPYPGQYPPYPAPGMPYGYGYPYPGVPQMPGQPGYGYPPPPQQPSYPQPDAELQEEEKPAAANVRLPDPSETGVKPPEPPDPAKAAADGQKTGPHIPTAAKDIIHSYLNRRPKTE